MSSTLYRKYRPGSFADVSGQTHVKRTLLNQLKTDSVAHAYLFTGPRGVGKTTLARLLAKAVNCEALSAESEPCNTCSACSEIINSSSLDVIEMDAASHTDVENIRENVIRQAQFAPSRLPKKVFIIDEVHMLSTSSFNALLKTLEEPPAHAIFILATTEIHKVPETIISRCQRFDFRRLPTLDLKARLLSILEKEGVTMDQTIVMEIIRRSDGCARDAESLLGQIIALGGDHIGLEDASFVLPLSLMGQLVDLLQALHTQDIKKSLSIVEEIVTSGADIGQAIEDLMSLMRDLLMIRLGGPFPDLWSEDWQKALAPLTKDVSPEWFMSGIERLLDAKRFTRSEHLPQLGLELVCAHLCFDATRENMVVTEIPKTASAPIPSPTIQTQPVTPPASLPPSFVPPPARSFVVSLETPPVAETVEVTLTSEAPQTTSDTPLKTNEPVVVQITEDVQPEAIEVTISEQKTREISTEDVQEKWEKVTSEVRARNASLPLVFQNGKVQNVVDGWVEVGFEFSFHAETLNQEKNRTLVDQILLEIYGQPLKVKGISITAPGEDTVSQLLSEFGGNVV